MCLDFFEFCVWEKMRNLSIKINRLVINIFCLLIFCFSPCLWANQSKGLKNQKRFKFINVEKLNFYQIQDLRIAYIDFLREVEKQIPLGNSKKSAFWQGIFINKVFAANNDPCFFGGWESIELKGLCKPPWKFGPDRDKFKHCSRKNTFRCSPTLFGGHPDGLCVDKDNTWEGLTSKCLRKSYEDDDEPSSTIERIQDNPTEFQNTSNKILAFCERKPSYTACKNLEHRLDELEFRGPPVPENLSSSANENQSKALGILNACQKHYEEENSGFFQSIFSSDGDILDRVTRGLNLCEQEENLGLANENLEDLMNISQDMTRILNENQAQKMLSDINQKAFQGNMEMLINTQLKYDDRVDKEGIKRRLKDSVSGLDGRIDAIHTKEKLKLVEEDESQRRRLSPQENIQQDIESLKDFGEQLNGLCKSIRDQYVTQVGDNRLKAQCTRRGLSKQCREYKQKRESFIKEIQNPENEIQKKTLSLVSQLSQQPQSRFLFTEHFRDDIFPGGADLAQKCATTPDFIAFNEHVDAENIQKAQKQVQDILYDELESVRTAQEALNSKDSDKILDAIKDTLKYRPHLIASYMNGLKGEELEQMAKLVCKMSLEIYDSDEWWNLGTAGVAVAGVALAPFTGGATLMAVGVGVAVGEVGIATRQWQDAHRAGSAVRAGGTTGDVSTHEAQQVLKQVEADKKGAVTDAVLATAFSGVGGVGLRALKRGARGVGRVGSSSTRIGNEVVEEVVERQSRGIVPSRTAAPKGSQAVDQTSSVSKVKDTSTVQQPKTEAPSKPSPKADDKVTEVAEGNSTTTSSKTKPLSQSSSSSVNPKTSASPRGPQDTPMESRAETSLQSSSSASEVSLSSSRKQGRSILPSDGPNAQYSPLQKDIFYKDYLEKEIQKLPRGDGRRLYFQDELKATKREIRKKQKEMKKLRKAIKPSQKRAKGKRGRTSSTSSAEDLKNTPVQQSRTETFPKPSPKAGDEVTEVAEGSSTITSSKTKPPSQSSSSSVKQTPSSSKDLDTPITQKSSTRTPSQPSSASEVSSTRQRKIFFDKVEDGDDLDNLQERLQEGLDHKKSLGEDLQKLGRRNNARSAYQEQLTDAERQIRRIRRQIKKERKAK